MNAGLKQLIERSILSPLKRKSVRLLTKAALFLCAAFFFLTAILFLTAAFFIWLVQLVGALLTALIFAGVCIAAGIIALLFALFGGREKASQTKFETAPKISNSTQSARSDMASDAGAERAAAINEALVPLIEVLRSLGLKREEFALLAGAELAKKLPPMTLVGLAIICGFLVGRIYKLPFGDTIIKKEAA